MKIAITGASGHLGTALLPLVFEKGHYIKALVREDDCFFGKIPVESVKGDLLDKGSLSLLMKDCDALIHCAAVISINGDPTGIVQQTNVEGTRMALETAKMAGIKRVLHISSIHAYQQKPALETLDEKRALVDETAFAYDRSKKAGQEIAISMNQAGMEVLVLNPTSIIGPYDHRPSKMGKVIIDLYNGRLPFVFEGGFDFCDCRDVANAIVNALTMGRPGENYLLSGKWYSFRELVQFISKASGKNIKAISLPPIIGKIGLPFINVMAWVSKTEPLYTNEAIEAISTGNRRIDCVKASKELDYHPRLFEETIADTIKWFQQNGYLVKHS